MLRIAKLFKYCAAQCKKNESQSGISLGGGRLSNRYTFGRFEIRPGERRLLVDGEPAVLGARALDLLLCLIAHRDRVVGKDELMQLVWPGVVVEENNLTVQVSVLRKLLGQNAVATVAGRGYQFTLAPSEPSSAPPEPASGRGVGEIDLSLPDIPSLAVLPFTNLSGDPEQEYFADGVVDDIISALSRVRAFFVIARNSSFSYKGKAPDVRQVGRELGVRYVLEGSIRKAGTRVRIAGQLVEAENGRHIWADRFEGNLDDIFELQDRITESVVAAIEPNLRLAEIERARAKPTANLHAYDLCLRAYPSLFRVTTKAANDEALNLLYRAIEVDPGYSLAKALCSSVFLLRKAQRWASAAEIKEGLRLADEALADHRDDPATLSYAAHSLSYLAFRHEDALRALDRSLSLNSNSTKTLSAAGWIRGYIGEAVRSIDHLQRAIRLNPLDPQLCYLLSGLGMSHLMIGKYEDALSLVMKALQEAPAWVSAYYVLIISLVQLGRLDEARSSAERLMKLTPDLTLAGRRAEMPYREPVFKELFINALRAAGIPE